MGMRQAKVPKLTKAHYWWIIGEMGNWYKEAYGISFKTFIMAIADSLAETNEAFNYDKFVNAAYKHYNLL